MCTICPDRALHLFLPEAFVAYALYLHCFQKAALTYLYSGFLAAETWSLTVPGVFLLRFHLVVIVDNRGLLLLGSFLVMYGIEVYLM